MEGDSFLPPIQSVFYSVFELRKGPKIVYQVPEGLIAVPPPAVTSTVPPTPSVENPSPPPYTSNGSRNSSLSLLSPSDYRPLSLGAQSPRKRSPSGTRTLFNFEDISQYVIPRRELCGRLVTCSTAEHRIMGFPMALRGKYERNYFEYNLCFVFERGADLSCYEPIVRKVSRVLTSCEVGRCTKLVPRDLTLS
jgi:nitrogen permease regulator 2-like protein